MNRIDASEHYDESGFASQTPSLLTVIIDTNPRASFYSAPVIYELRRAGLMPDIMKRAFVPHGVAWRRLPKDGGATIGPEDEICRIVTPNEPGELDFGRVASI